MEPSVQPTMQQTPPIAAQPTPQAAAPAPKVGRIKRGWQLTKSSWHILRLDKELTALPLISFFAALVVLIPIGIIFITNTTYIGVNDLAQNANEPTYTIDLAPSVQFALGFIAYFGTTLIANFFGGAVIYGAAQRFKGGDPTLSTSIAGASRKIRPLILFSLMMTTVGLILQALEERLPFAGRIAVSLFDAAWNIANVFAIPVIVLSEGNVGPIQATKQSVNVIKKVWGESIIVNLGIGIIGAISYIMYLLIFGLAGAAAFSLGGGQINAPMLAIGGIGFIGFIGLILIFSTLSSIAKAALYHYAVTGEAPGAFDKELLRTTMTPKKASKIFR